MEGFHLVNIKIYENFTAFFSVFDVCKGSEKISTEFPIFLIVNQCYTCNKFCELLETVFVEIHHSPSDQELYLFKK